MKNLFPILVVAASLWQVGCLHHQYIPNTHNQPMLTKKDEQRFTVGLSSQNLFGTGDVQYARALTSKYTLLTNASWTLASQDESKMRGGLLEIGGGRFWYKPNQYAETNKPDGVIFELYGGGGLGYYYNKYYNSNGDGSFFPPVNPGPVFGNSKVNFGRAYFQPSIGYRNSAIELGISTRFSYLNFYGADFTGNDPEAKDIYRALSSKKSHFLFEPGATIRVGLGKVKFQGQMGFSNIPEVIGSKFYVSWGLVFAPHW